MRGRLAVGRGREDRVEEVAAGPVAVALPPPTSLQVMSLLSEREGEIVLLVVGGLSNKEIGLRLGISHWTVSTHLRRVFAKLDVSRRIELCALVPHLPDKRSARP